MGSYDVLNTYKQKIKKMFLQNQDLQKLIYYNIDNPLAQPNLLNPNVLFKGERPLVLFKSKNFKTITEQSTFLLVRFLTSPDYLPAYDDISIIITIATHNDLSELYDGRDRIDAICTEIDKYLNGHNYIGVGSVKHEGRKEVTINDDYIGYNLIYSVSDWGKNYDNQNK